MEGTSSIGFIELIAAGMILIFVLSTAIVLFVLIYQRRLANHQLKLQELKLEHQAMLIQSAIQVTEDERRQFASNLHDEIGAQIAIAKITLSSIEESDATTLRTVDQTLGILDEISTSIRTISHHIMPPILLKLGLHKAIEHSLSKMEQQQIHVRFSSTIGARRYKQDEELHAFRIFQEALSNAIKHAKCTQIDVQLVPVNNAFHLLIADNGKGFQSAQLSGTGLINMENRAHLINFQLDITCTESGVTISLQPKTNTA